MTLLMGHHDRQSCRAPVARTAAVSWRAAYSLLADLRQLALNLRVVHIARFLEVKPARVGDFMLKALIQERERIREATRDRYSGRIISESSRHRRP
jgi:hypothetical protein